MAQYGKIEYWNERYTLDKEPFDWYQRYSGIRHFFEADYLTNDPSDFPPREERRVLVVGCGNSRLSEEMLEDGYGSVTSVDWSPVVIEQMKTQYPNSKYVEMDVTEKLSFADDSFDVVVCKGVLDAVLCGSGSLKSAKTMLMECSRVLGDRGAVVVVSYGTPENRMVYFESKEFGWTVDVHTVAKPRLGVSAAVEASGEHYVYILQKGTHPMAEEPKTELVQGEEEEAKVKDEAPEEAGEGSKIESKSSADSP